MFVGLLNTQHMWNPEPLVDNSQRLLETLTVAVQAFQSLLLDTADATARDPAGLAHCHDICEVSTFQSNLFCHGMRAYSWITSMLSSETLRNAAGSFWCQRRCEQLSCVLCLSLLSGRRHIFQRAKHQSEIHVALRNLIYSQLWLKRSRNMI